MKPINPFNLVFEDENIEREFRQRFVSLELIYIKRFIVLLILFNSIYVVRDMWLPTDRGMDSIKFQGYIILPVCLILYLLFSRHIYGVGRFFKLGIFLFLFTMISQLTLLLINDGDGSGMVSIFLVVIVACYSFSGIIYKHLLYLTLPMVVLTTILIFLGWPSFTVTTKINYLMIHGMTYIGTLMIKYRTEHYQRADFLHTNRLEKKGEKLNKSLDRVNEESNLRKNIISVLAHDLRSPIANLRAILDLTKSKSITEEESRNFLARLDDQVLMVDFLINDILVWIKSQASSVNIEMASLDVNQAAQDLSFIFNDQLTKKGVDLHYQIQVSQVKCHPDMIKAVLRNLISNALKFSQQGSSIELKVSSSGAGRVSFYVIDHGVGMDEVRVKRLESTFNSRKGTNMESGTGLGLKICQSLLKVHGSTMRISSEVNKGTAIEFELAT
ncbi:sensor histidine kinase [Reichenbachiella versicolor]|uniref:sensor histidine kinase n=1 Tax=Reichenbachiella versicolor TaxID=1821036 RepID=UPI000D6E9C1D|nr:HAMP domain-containing sensor histidine kinase [Reichenbachiella versicolor]